jgi:hypothetical protein
MPQRPAECATGSGSKGDLPTMDGSRAPQATAEIRRSWRAFSGASTPEAHVRPTPGGGADRVTPAPAQAEGYRERAGAQTATGKTATEARQGRTTGVVRWVTGEGMRAHHRSVGAAAGGTAAGMPSMPGPAGCAGGLEDIQADWRQRSKRRILPGATASQESRAPGKGRCRRANGQGKNVQLVG